MKKIKHRHPSRKRGIGFTQTLTIPGEMIWDAQKPRYNAWQTGHGAHRDKSKYDRNENKQRLRTELDQS